MNFKFRDPKLGECYIQAQFVTWNNGFLILACPDLRITFLCSRRRWESMKFWWWFGNRYHDITCLSLLSVVSS